MILRPMTADEFPAYREIFIKEYADDIASSRGCSNDDAVARATSSIDLTLEQGVNTPQNRLLCIASPAEDTLGYLWLVVSGQTVWISDFYIYPQWRDQGLGAEALELLGNVLMVEGITEIGLRVAIQNGAAKHLYEKAGFAVTGFNMSKSLI